MNSRPVYGPFARASAVWNRLSLSQQSLFIAFISINILIPILATWIGNTIEQAILRHTAASRAVSAETILSPLVQGLARQQEDAARSREALSTALAGVHTPRGIRIAKLWSSDGSVAFSNEANDSSTVKPSDRRDLDQALKGEVSFGLLKFPEVPRSEPVFVTYVPLRQVGTEDIIAVAKLHESAAKLAEELKQTRVQVWLFVGLLTLLGGLALFAVMSRDRRAFDWQKKAMMARVSELSSLLSENMELQKSLRAVNALTAQNYERLLRQIGADLHDGAAQLVSLALLWLGNLKPGCNRACMHGIEDEVERIRRALSDSLIEIRALSAGIAPPHLDRISPSEAIQVSVRTHERRTGTSVACEIGPFPEELPPLLKTCLYRFVQEGLNNAYRHANGQGQKVRAVYAGGEIMVEVSDRGPGIAHGERVNGAALGLAGMRARIESLDGRLEIESRPGAGTRLITRFKLAETPKHAEGTFEKVLASA